MLFSRICVFSEPFLKSNISRSQFFEAFLFFLEKIMPLEYEGHIPTQNKRRGYLRGKNVDTRAINPILRKRRKPLEIYCLIECTSTF